MLALLLVSASPPAHGAGPADDQVEAYLLDHGLDGALSVVLERRLARDEGDARRATAHRLASLYARELERTPSPERLAALEEKSSALLRELDEKQGLDLRLALARSAYLRAERSIERARVGLAPESEADSARRLLELVGPRLTVIAMAAGDRVRALEEQEEVVTDGEALLRAALTESRRVRLNAWFLAGWASVYLAELDGAGREQQARHALVAFGTLLNAEPRAPADPARARKHMLEDEPGARAAIGCALAEQFMGNAEGSDRWVRLLLEAPDLPLKVKAALPAWRIVIMAHRDDWAGVLSVTDRVEQERRGAGPEPLTPVEARLLAWLALAPGAGAGGDGAARAAERGIVALGALGEIGALADLAPRALPLMERAGSPYLSNLLRGLRDLRLADERAGVNDSAQRPPPPAPDATALALYASAERSLGAALSLPPDPRLDASRGAAALARAAASERRAQDAAGCLASSALYAEASTILGRSDPARAAEAQRLAIGAAERAIELAPEDERAREALAREIGVFLSSHADHPASGAYALRAALAPGIDRQRSIVLLGAIPPNSPVFRQARRELTRLRYLDYREAPPSASTSAATLFLQAASPVLEADASDEAAGRLGQPDAAASVARMVLDGALAVGRREAALAQRAFDLLSALHARQAVPGADFQAEYRYRKVQMAVLRGQPALADEALSELEAIDPAAAAQARRLVLDQALASWRDARAGQPGAARSALARRVVALGRAVLRELEAAAPSADSAGTDRLLVQGTVAEAASALWSFDRDEEMRVLAALLYRAELRAAPDPRDLLEGA
ncbi:MAG TPA: hypothetical protein DEB06_01590, partial [Phycisphaerales bacterium]|nr:hypothetical protein [Phycisphaerales bacterium]